MSRARQLGSFSPTRTSPNCCADPMPNSPPAADSNLFSSASAGAAASIVAAPTEARTLAACRARAGKPACTATARTGARAAACGAEKAFICKRVMFWSIKGCEAGGAEM